MRVPVWVSTLGYLGLFPFLAGPGWLMFSPDPAPVWLDRAWWMYTALLAAFLSGTFWGFALPMALGPAGSLGLVIASVLMGMTWIALMLPFESSLYALMAIFLLLLAADLWRERVLDTIPGYLALRSILTVGAIAAIAWRLGMM